LVELVQGHARQRPGRYCSFGFWPFCRLGAKMRVGVGSGGRAKQGNERSGVPHRLFRMADRLGFRHCLARRRECGPPSNTPRKFFLVISCETSSLLGPISLFQDFFHYESINGVNGPFLTLVPVSFRAASSPTGPGAPLRSRRTVCLERLHEVAARIRQPAQYEPQGRPWDNAACESFLKTLKYEEVYRSQYRDLADAHSQIRRFLEQVYNRRRLHSALGYLPPAEFERHRLAHRPAPTTTERSL
jgi:hypothetical protein